MKQPKVLVAFLASTHRGLRPMVLLIATALLVSLGRIDRPR